MSSAAGSTYFYDNNGNLTRTVNSANAITREIAYTPFNLPTTIKGHNPNVSGLAASTTLTYAYDADHARVSESVSGGASTRHASAGFFEVATNADGSREYRHYLAGPDGTIGIYTARADVNNPPVSD